VSKPLVVVESPTKVKTIKKYLGDQYNVASTVGHIKDLPQKEIGIDIQNDFEPKYVTIPGKQKVIKALRDAAGDASDIYLAPDPDREGEAIAWHTADVLKKKGRQFHRVLFHELTKKAVSEALGSPEQLNENRYKAQQTRRILDRLVGYQISPILWKKVKYGLSAGRVQSVAVRMICERERAIFAFEPREYWSITARLEGGQPPAFDAKLVKKDGRKVSIPDEKTATAIHRELSDADWTVEKIARKTVRRRPYPPFTTSKLQQEAIRKLRFSAKKTMTVAQQLYEGIDLGGETVGLITYMRTDSTRISGEAAEEAKNLILARYGKDYALDKPRFFANKNRTQDAHEAIRRKVSIPDEKTASAVHRELSGTDWTVEKIARKTVRRRPYPPFTTSKLQQEAIRKLRFSAKKTMTVAQQLYEGIDLGGETVGLITYMRTDSTRISGEAAEEAKNLILARYGKDYALDKPRFFANKNRTQDAHEAIRPTSVNHEPEKIARYLSADQLSLYRIIWQRFVASQMAEALIDQKTLSIAAGSYLFTASGSTVKFPGFLAMYQSADDAIDAEEEKAKGRLPELAEKEQLRLLSLEPKQHFTQPPPRFTEATLVKELEENGIGRPSTYAAILSTIREKGYVDLLKGVFRPNELGFIITDLLIHNFPDIVDVDFTARLENDLDRVESAELDAKQLLEKFYEVFENRLLAAADEMLSVKGVGLPTGMKCPECSRELRIKVGKNGPFLACEGYPDCMYSRNYERDEKGNIRLVEPVRELAEGETCEKCGRDMIVKQGRYGDFLACSGYPECKNTRSVHGGGRGEPVGVLCPEAGCTGEIVEKRSRRGKVFYGCNRYPDCTFALWDRPVNRSCPDCGAPYLIEKETKKEGKLLRCATRGCGYKQAPEEAEAGEKAGS